MAFGMRNEPASVQHLLQFVLGDVPHCRLYQDDVVLHSDSWEGQISTPSEVFCRLAQVTFNLAKCEFGKATVIYLGKPVGHGQVFQ